MQFRGDAYVEFPGEGPSRCNALFPAHLQKDLQRGFPLLAQGVHVGTLEVGAAVEFDESPPEQVDVRVVGDDRLVAVDFHDVHGMTPCISSQRRMLATAPWSVSGLGWGRPCFCFMVLTCSGASKGHRSAGSLVEGCPQTRHGGPAHGGQA